MRSTSDALLSASCRHSHPGNWREFKTDPSIHSFIHPPTTSATGALAGNGNNRIPLSLRLLVGGYSRLYRTQSCNEECTEECELKTHPSAFACCSGEVRNNIQRKEEYSFLCIWNAVTGENQKDRNTSAPPVIIARNQWMNKFEGSHVCDKGSVFIHEV